MGVFKVGVLSSGLRRELEVACVGARRVSEVACGAVLGSLGVVDDRVPGHLGEGDRVLRRGLRAKSRQLGDVSGSIDLLVSECAFEQWHRLLFARFLAENGLLIHPEFGASVSLSDCEELAEGLGEPDGWAVAGRFAAEILPGIFRVDDPCVALRLAPEGRLELEGIVSGLPVEVFQADDALGWVYQFWQSDKKDEVNASERKIGGADLGPVTQLFTENYMVRFLLENSLGAWWAARHPDSPLLSEWEFLRFDDEGAPAAGAFEGWPDSIAEVSVMDPCCGSGHFLVEAFSMLWRMRAEEEGLDPIVAQDAVLQDNLFGLELDARCVQIAMFAVALQAWKAGGGWRELPTPNIACSGIPVKAPVDEWKALAKGDERLENALERLHILFRDADTLGSLIDPKRAVEITDSTGLQTSTEDVDWNDIQPLLTRVLEQEEDDPATAVLGADAAGIARTADYLSGKYVLVATNPPYLTRRKQSEVLQRLVVERFPKAQADLATAFLERISTMLVAGGADATLTPQNWLSLGSYEELRLDLLRNRTWNFVVRLGSGASATKSWDTLRTLLVSSKTTPRTGHEIPALDVTAPDDSARAVQLRNGALEILGQHDQLSNPDARIVLVALGDAPLLETFAYSYVGVQTSDSPRFVRYHWEQFWDVAVWVPQQSTVRSPILYGGRETVLRWEGGNGELEKYAKQAERTLKRAHRRGLDAWGSVRNSV